MRFWQLVLMAVAWTVSGGAAAQAMGYDSLACPELAERRIAYFTQNGFCDPAISDAQDCKAITPGAEEQLPAADKGQVQMIVRTEARKDCPAK